MCARNRLIQFLEHIRLSKRRFYIQVGLSSGFLTKNKNIGSDKIARTAKEFPQLNIDWLITGRGKMLNPVSALSGEEETRYLPILDITTVLEFPRADSNTYKNKALDMISLGKGYRNCTIAVQMWGDSMTPVYASGDVVALRPVHGLDYVQWGHAHLIITPEQHFFRCLTQNEKPKKISLESIRRDYEAFEIEVSQITALYEARAIVRKLML